MALGTLLFAKVNVNSLSTEVSEEQPQEEASLVLTPPTPIHGLFVGTLSGAWSFATTYVGLDALFVAISALRRKNKLEGDIEEDLINLFEYILKDLQDELHDREVAKEMESLSAQLQQMSTQLDNKRLYNGFDSDFEQALIGVINQIPDSVLKRKGYTREKLQEFVTEKMHSNQQKHEENHEGKNHLVLNFHLIRLIGIRNK
ncbi:MAG: hypothetical protein HC903_14830 [Methylacidiphilales bacterium]|nr:hypothetical protein [Candidatus Methylacidiphilales bacterium]